MFNPSQHMMKLPKKRKNAKGQWETVYADYLEVKWRIVWFREDKPNWAIDATPVKLDESIAIFKAEVKDEEGRTVSVGHGSENKQSFTDYIEKAETRAIGRALAVLGYGTQFAPELDEEEHIADAPVERPTSEPKQSTTDDPVVPFGKYKGNTVGEIYKKDKGYVEYLAEKAEQTAIKDAANALLGKDIPLPF